jgi:predicted Holliday junction resolvase-like endonuclease
MPFLVVILLILLIPVVFVFLLLNGVIYKLKRAFRGATNASSVKHSRHPESEGIINEVAEEEIEYSEEDIIEAEFEEIDEERTEK